MSLVNKHLELLGGSSAKSTKKNNKKILALAEPESSAESLSESSESFDDFETDIQDNIPQEDYEIDILVQNLIKELS